MKQILHKALALKALMLSAVLALCVGNAWAEEKTITLDYSSFGLSTSYGTKTATVGDFGFTVNQGYKGSGNTIQMNSSKGSGILYNTTPISGLKSITVNVYSGSKTYTITTGTSEQPTANSQTGTTGGTYNAASGDTYFQLKVSGASYFSSIVITYEDGGDPSLDDCNLALEDDALEFDLYNNASAQVINYTTSSTGAVTIDDSDYATFAIDEEHKTITVTPTAVTPDVVTITVNQAADESYKAGSTTFDLLIDDSTPIPTHTATFSVNGETSNQDFEEGADIEFPEDPADVLGKSFVGWVTEAIVGSTDDTPAFVTSAKMSEADVTYYAVFANVDEGDVETITDVLNQAWTGVTGTSYSNWSGKTSNSDAVYAGNSAGGNSSIQLRTSSNTGIVTTTSGGKVTKVEVEWDSHTSDTRTLDIYGSNKAFTGIDNLFPATAYTKLGSIVNGESTTLNITGDYAYVGIRSNNGALYASSISITWENGTPASYSEYCTTVVEATVARPTIVVAANPFTFSTTATITCDTEDAAIKYSYDGENWNDYEEALTITATTTIYAKAVKDENESSIASVTATKNLATPTVAIDATGITNTNVFDGTEAGSLAATVTYNEEDVEGAVVTWSGNNDEVATIDAETGAVTLVAAGSVTFTATYAGNSDYAEKTATYEMTVTNTDPNAPGTENNPYTVAQAIAFINTLGSATSSEEVYVSGIISQVDSYNSKYSSITYWISDDGTTDGQMEVYSGKGLNGADFASVNDLSVGDIVTVKGLVKMYNTTPEFTSNSEIVTRITKPAAPEFSVAEGEYPSAQTVELTAEDGATIYYTLDGTEPTAESTEYTSAIEVTETTTIKAIAVKDDVASDVATATYTINTTPFVTVAQTTVNVDEAGAEGSIEVTYNNMTEGDFIAEVVYCDAEGNDAEYDWLVAEINAENNNIEYVVAENTSTEARTAYIKVYALYDDDYFSDIITFTQAGMIVDYAELPFEWDDKVAPTGITNNGVATYNSSPYLKFDGTGDEIILKLNERPGVLSFDVKGNSFSDGTFKVQTSSDGENYTDLATYTDAELESTTATMYYYDFAEDIRYIKWVYTEKKTGNVALGNIKMSAYMAPYTRSVKSGNYGTICLPYDAIITGANLYSIGGEANGWLHLNEETTLEAGTPYIFEATADAINCYYTGSVEATEALTIRGLVGSLTGTSVPTGKYILKNNEIRLAGTGVTIGANRAYIDMEQVPAYDGASVKAITIFDNATGINGIDATANGETIYNVAGQRMQKLQKGINIVGGRKVIVK